MTDSGHRHHAIDYIELTVTDSAAAKAFYAAAFGWQFNDYGPAYAGIANPGGPDLPEVGGFSLLGRLRRSPDLRAIPVIALTANAMQRDIERGMAAGFTRYLTKPIDIDKFTDAINSTLAQAARKDA